MIDPIADIQRRLAVLENRARFSNRPITGIVTNNVDPEGRNRVKVSCQELYGDNGESPWLVDRASVNGNGIGSVWTPALGTSVSVVLRDGNADAGEYTGGARDVDSAIPEDFIDPNINGERTSSGIVIIKNDNTGDYSFETEGGMLILHTNGTMDIYGIEVNIHSPVNCNSENPQFGIVTSSPTFSCPLFGPHRGSLTVKASD